MPENEFNGIGRPNDRLERETPQQYDVLAIDAKCDEVKLAVGGRADPLLVRPGADEAWIEARFEQENHSRSALGTVPCLRARS